MTTIKICKLLLASLCLLAAFHTVAQAGSNTDELWAMSEQGYIEPEQSAVSIAEQTHPRGIIALPEETKYLIWVELASGRLNLIERLGEKSYRTLKTIPISIGKNGYGKEIEGDKRTPVGVYRVTRYIPDEELTEFYGLGAYPINYPNAWDKLQNRTGYGIWLHGLPKGVDERPLLDSDGCVVLDNKSLTYLGEYVTPGNTIVLLGNDLEWITKTSAKTMENQEADAIISAIETWRQSWESLDSPNYLSNYHPEFSNFKYDLEGWSQYKTRVNGSKSTINVDITGLSVIRYPDTDNLVSVHFHQDYQSDNYNWSGWKELLWRKDASGNWKIVYEGNG